MARGGRLWRGGVALGASALFALLPGASALAAAATPATGTAALQTQMDQLSAQAAQIQEQLSGEQSALHTAQSSASYWESKRGATEAQVQSQVQTVDALQQQLTTVGQQLATASAHLLAAEQRLVQLEAQADQGLVTLFEGGTVRLVGVLLGSATFSDFLTRFGFLQAIFAQDIDLMRQVRAQNALITSQRAALLAQQQSLTGLQQQATQQVALLDQDAQQYQQAASAQDAAAEGLSSEIAAEEQASAQVTTMLQSLQIQYARASGQLVFDWPLPAPHVITSPFGPRYVASLNDGNFHTGIDIAEPSGTPIHAAAAGVVVLAAWDGGYGNAVILYHGKQDGVDYYTLYAHQSKLAVKKDQDVTQGQVIGYVGATGNATGPHLHFEIRQNGTPVNPMPFLAQTGVVQDY